MHVHRLRWPLPSALTLGLAAAGISLAGAPPASAATIAGR
jgi:hypothetical protein